MPPIVESTLYIEKGSVVDAQSMCKGQCRLEEERSWGCRERYLKAQEE